MVSPKPDSGINPTSTRGDPPKVFEHQHRRKDDERELDKDSSRTQYGRDPYKHSDRYSSRNSRGYSRQDEYSRREKCADEEGRRFQASSRSSRDDKYSLDKYDSSKHRSKDKETESVALDRQKFRDKDASPDIANKKDRDRRDRNSRDEKRDYHRSFGDHKSDRASYYEGSKGYRNDSSGLHLEGLHFRESYKNDQKEQDRKKHNDSSSNREKDRHGRALQHEDKTVYGFENQESLAKKPKFLSSDKDAEEGMDANEKQKQVFDVDGKAAVGKNHVNNSEAENDLNVAKVAAMKAAELVNKNLVGVGFMSTEQKKKLLWGSKKSTTSQESGNRWDTPLFDDRERQEKFNKLMSLRLPWYLLWPIVGCEGGCENRAQTRCGRRRSREGEGSPDGFGEAIHCRTSTERRSHSWVGSLSVCLRSFCIFQRMFCDILLYSFAITLVTLRQNMAFATTPQIFVCMLMLKFGFALTLVDYIRGQLVIINLFSRGHLRQFYCFCPN